MPSNNNNHHHSASHAGSGGPGSTPTHRSAGSGEGSAGGGNGGGGGGGGSGGGSTAASKRREANRLAAARFRTRKKDQVVDLEGRVAGLEQESSVLKGEVRSLRGKLGLDTEVPVVGPIGGQGSGGAVISVSMQERVGTPLLGGGSHADSPGMGSHRSLNSMGPGDEDEDEEMDLAASSKKRRKVGGRGGTGAGSGDGANEEEMLQLKEQLRGYQATMRVMQEEIALLKGKKPSSMGRTPSFTLDPSLADVKPGAYTQHHRSSGRSASGGSSRHYVQHSDSATSNDLADDAMAAQGLASLHLPLPRPGYERGDTGTSSHLSLPPLSPVLRIDSASPGNEYEGESARGGGYTTGSHGGGTSVMMGRSIHGLPTSRPHSPLSLSPALPQPGRPTSPMSIERLSSPSPLGANYKDSSSAARTLNALQNAAFAVGMQLGGGSGPSSPLGAASGRESPLARNRSWGLGGATPSGLGLASLPHSRAGSRGLDSPISAERSGANDDDDSPDSGGYAQDYFGRYAAGANAAGASGAGTGQQGGSRLREERDFEKTEDGEDDVTPPAKATGGRSKKVVEVDPSLLKDDDEDDGRKPIDGDVKEEDMEVDTR